MTGTNFDEGEKYSGSYQKDQLSFREIILQHLKKITEFSSVEWKGGYWEQRIIPMGSGGMTQKVYVPDTRDIYSNAVEVFGDLLFPHYDEEMKTEDKRIQNKIDAITKEEKSLEQFKQDKRKIMRDLFRQISCFLKRRRYLELGEVGD
jgi:hypothetical protein